MLLAKANTLSILWVQASLSKFSESEIFFFLHKDKLLSTKQPLVGYRQIGRKGSWAFDRIALTQMSGSGSKSFKGDIQLMFDTIPILPFTITTYGR